VTSPACHPPMPVGCTAPTNGGETGLRSTSIAPRWPTIFRSKVTIMVFKLWREGILPSRPWTQTSSSHHWHDPSPAYRTLRQWQAARNYYRLGRSMARPGVAHSVAALALALNFEIGVHADWHLGLSDCASRRSCQCPPAGGGGLRLGVALDGRLRRENTSAGQCVRDLWCKFYRKPSHALRFGSGE
jgi:hypothetical protein